MIEIKELKSKEDFEEFKNLGNRIACVKFSATWCGPCRVLENTIKGLEKEKIGDAQFAELDVDTEGIEDVLAESRIRNVPVMVFYQGGFERMRLVGNVPATEIYNVLNKLSDGVDNNVS